MMRDVPVWTQDGRAPGQFAWFDEDAQADVCVVGGGLTGALCALRLAREGASVILLTRRQLGYGATASLMPGAPCDCGESLRALGRRIGRENAARLFTLADDSAARLGELCELLGGEIGFSRRDSLIYTDDEAELEQLSRECLERRRQGLDCAMVSRSALRDAFPFAAAGAIIVRDGAVELNPYRLTHAAARAAIDHGARVFENTGVERIDSCEGGGVTVTTGTYRTVQAKLAVVAAGAACAGLIDGLLPARTRCMAVSPPVRSFAGWPGRCVVRSFGAPNITCAASPDGRVFISGLASSSEDSRARLSGMLRMRTPYTRRLEELEASVRYLFPEVCTAAFVFGQAIGGVRTCDGLPIIGRVSGHPDCLFAVAGGAGGLLMSELASRLVVRFAQGDEVPDAAMFSPDRRRLAG